MGVSMKISYRRASENDIEYLVERRLAFIDVVASDKEYSFIQNNTREYFQHAMKVKQCDVILAEHMNTVVGTGVVFYYDSVPSKFNPWGKNAYITSMYVHHEHRRQGIATKILDELVSIACEKGYHIFLLQESEMGRFLYEKYGFVQGTKGMLMKMEF